MSERASKLKRERTSFLLPSHRSSETTTKHLSPFPSNSQHQSCKKNALNWKNSKGNIQKNSPTIRTQSPSPEKEPDKACNNFFQARHLKFYSQQPVITATLSLSLILCLSDLSVFAQSNTVFSTGAALNYGFCSRLTGLLLWPHVRALAQIANTYACLSGHVRTHTHIDRNRWNSFGPHLWTANESGDSGARIGHRLSFSQSVFVAPACLWKWGAKLTALIDRQQMLHFHAMCLIEASRYRLKSDWGILLKNRT